METEHAVLTGPHVPKELPSLYDMALCITLPETPERRDAAYQHLTQRGVRPQYMRGICGKAFGLMTVHCYEVDHPGSGYRVASKHVGLHLSHYMAWSLCEASDGDSFMILEDDAEFSINWRHELEQALTAVPDDWDMLFIGSCNCQSKATQHVNGPIYIVHWPQCTHAYMVRRPALEVLLETQRYCWAPIDLSLIFRSFPKLRVYTVLPRIVGQRNQEIAP